MPSQPNAHEPTVTRLSGRRISEVAGILWNASAPIVSSPSGRVRAVRDVSAKALSPIVRRVEGSVIPVIPSPQNAWSPIVESPSCRVIAVIFVLMKAYAHIVRRDVERVIDARSEYLNAPSPMLSTPSGSVSVVIFELRNA